MKNIKPAWKPQYRVTWNMVQCLMDEAIRTTVDRTALTTAVEAKLHRRARLYATHYSTRIEEQSPHPGRGGTRRSRTGGQGTRGGNRMSWRSIVTRDALLKVEAWAAIKRPLTREPDPPASGWVEHGPRSRPTPFPGAPGNQNVIRDSASGAIVYMPPEASDVPRLMNERSTGVMGGRPGCRFPWWPVFSHYPVPSPSILIMTAMAGRRGTGTFILQRGGYGLQGFSPGRIPCPGSHNTLPGPGPPPHPCNYYEGRANADLTPG